MNAAELEYTLKLAAQIEMEAAELYALFADTSPAGSRERQFWQLLSYEEKTHSQVMDLIAGKLEPGFYLAPEDTPVPLRNNLHGLRQFLAWIRDCKKAATAMTGDQHWMVRLANDLETSEADKILDWLMLLPVPEGTRHIIDELVRGTTDHARRVTTFGDSLPAESTILPAAY